MATINAINSNIPIEVSKGGTGAATLTGVLIGNGTSAVTASTVTQYGTVIAGSSNTVSSVAPSATSGVPYISQGAAANPAFGTAVVAGGGTGNTTFTAYSVICGGTTSTGAFQNVSGVGTSGQVLTSNGASALPTWQAAASGGVTSATGTANQITVSASTGAVTWSIPSTFVAPGSIEATTSIKADTIFNTVTTTSSAGQYQINSGAVLHTYGSNNSFTGGAGNFTLTTGSATANTACGSSRTLIALTTGTSNVAYGDYTLHALTTGSYNSAFGQDSLDSITTGSYNVAVGEGAGGNCTTGSESHNIYINSLGANNESNVCRIGAATGTGTRQINKTFIHGVRGITTVNADAIAVLVDSAGQFGTVSSSLRFKENIKDLDDSERIYNLRPVSFNYKTQSGKKSTGLIAEEVLEVYPELVSYNQEGDVESVKYHDLPVLLLNEIKKLRARIEELERRM